VSSKYFGRKKGRAALSYRKRGKSRKEKLSSHTRERGRRGKSTARSRRSLEKDSLQRSAELPASSSRGKSRLRLVEEGKGGGSLSIILLKVSSRYKSGERGGGDSLSAGAPKKEGPVQPRTVRKLMPLEPVHSATIFFTVRKRRDYLSAEGGREYIAAAPREKRGSFRHRRGTLYRDTREEKGTEKRDRVRPAEGKKNSHSSLPHCVFRQRGG